MSRWPFQRDEHALPMRNTETNLSFTKLCSRKRKTTWSTSRFPEMRLPLVVRKTDFQFATSYFCFYCNFHVPATAIKFKVNLKYTHVNYMVEHCKSQSRRVLHRFGFLSFRSYYLFCFSPNNSNDRNNYNERANERASARHEWMRAKHK